MLFDTLNWIHEKDNILYSFTYFYLISFIVFFLNIGTGEAREWKRCGMFKMLWMLRNKTTTLPLTDSITRADLRGVADPVLSWCRAFQNSSAVGRWSLVIMSPFCTELTLQCSLQMVLQFLPIRLNTFFLVILLLYHRRHWGKMKPKYAHWDVAPPLQS